MHYCSVLFMSPNVQCHVAKNDLKRLDGSMFPWQPFLFAVVHLALLLILQLKFHWKMFLSPPKMQALEAVMLFNNMLHHWLEHLSQSLHITTYILYDTIRVLQHVWWLDLSRKASLLALWVPIFNLWQENQFIAHEELEIAHWLQLLTTHCDLTSNRI